MKNKLGLLIFLCLIGADFSTASADETALKAQRLSVSLPIYDINKMSPPAVQKIQLVPMNKKGYFVPVVINGLAHGTFMIDTAASHTVLSNDMARRAGLHSKSNASTTVITVLGKTQLPMIDSDSLKIGPYQIRNLNIILQDLDTSLGIDGLLGLDVLNRFDFSLSRDSLILNIPDEAGSPLLR